MTDAIANLTVTQPLTAARFMLAVGMTSNALNDALIDVQERVDAAEFKQLRHAVGSVLGGELYELRSRLIALYPELDTPDLETLMKKYQGELDA